MKKRKWMLFSAIIYMLTAGTGCGVNNKVVDYEDTSSNITTITFFGNKYEPENVTVIESIISDFMKENPKIRVSYESLKGSAYYDALEKRMASGKGNDVFMVNHDILLKLEKQGQVADLSQISTISDYTDDMMSQMEENGKIYWLPTTVSAFGLYCNIDMLQKHEMEIPQNLTEWEKVCDYFVSQGVTPIVANNDISLKTLVIGRGFFDLYQENRQVEVFHQLNSGSELLSAYFRPGLELVDSFIKKEYINAGQTLKTQKTSDDLEEFVKGESPFLLTGVWASGRLDEMSPDFAFKIVPLPVLEDGSLLVINPDTRLSVNADSAHLDAAMKFIEYFTQKENIQEFVNQQSSFSPLKEGNPSLTKEIFPLISCYESQRTVIGADGMLELPIWNLTEETVKQLLSGKELNDVIEWLDQQAKGEKM